MCMFINHMKLVYWILAAVQAFIFSYRNFILQAAECEQPIRLKAQWETRNFLLEDPVGLGVLPLDQLGGSEPEGNLLLGVLDGVGTVADVAADVQGVVATDGAGSGGQGVGGAQDGAAGLDGVLALPDHGADGAAQHV